MNLGHIATSMHTNRPNLTRDPEGPSVPPRVMFLIDDLSVGGAERVLVTLVNNAQRIRPFVALLRPIIDAGNEPRPGIDLACLSSTDGSRWNGGLPSPLRDRTLASCRASPHGRIILETQDLLRTAHRLARVARAANCRIISTFLNRAHTVALTAQLLFSRQLCVVLNIHEMLSDHLQLHFSPLERRLMRSFIKNAFPRADRIVAVAHGVTSDLVNHFGLSPDRITVIHNPLDLNRIRRMANALITPELCTGNTIVAVGRMVRLKGFDILLRAVSRLSPALAPQLVIIGDGEERGEIERLIAELCLGNRVRLLGFQANPWAIMARAKVIVLPSRTEAFPSVIGEALALSVPVVASRCSDGVAEYLDGGKCGILFPPEDVEALAGALARVLRDEALRQHLATHGKARVETFNTPLTVPCYEDMILELAG